MAELQQTRYDKIIRRVGGIVATGSMVSETVSELFPMIDVERVPGELLLLGGTEICHGSHVNVPGAANAARVQLFNPVGSGKLVMVSKFVASAAAAGNLRISLQSTALPNAANPETFRDSRRPATSQPAAQVRFDAVPTLADPIVQIFIANNLPFTLSEENTLAVLSPGFGYEIGFSTVNVTLRVSLWWRERVAELSELSF